AGRRCSGSRRDRACPRGSPRRARRSARACGRRSRPAPSAEPSSIEASFELRVHLAHALVGGEALLAGIAEHEAPPLRQLERLAFGAPAVAGELLAELGEAPYAIDGEPPADRQVVG